MCLIVLAMVFCLCINVKVKDMDADVIFEDGLHISSFVQHGNRYEVGVLYKCEYTDRGPLKMGELYQCVRSDFIRGFKRTSKNLSNFHDPIVKSNEITPSCRLVRVECEETCWFMASSIDSVYDLFDEYQELLTMTKLHSHRDLSSFSNFVFPVVSIEEFYELVIMFRAQCLLKYTSQIDFIPEGNVNMKLWLSRLRFLVANSNLTAAQTHYELHMLSIVSVRLMDGLKTWVIQTFESLINEGKMSRANPIEEAQWQSLISKCRDEKGDFTASYLESAIIRNFPLCPRSIRKGVHMDSTEELLYVYKSPPIAIFRKGKDEYARTLVNLEKNEAVCIIDGAVRPFDPAGKHRAMPIKYGNKQFAVHMSDGIDRWHTPFDFMPNASGLPNMRIEEWVLPLGPLKRRVARKRSTKPM